MPSALEVAAAAVMAAASALLAHLAWSYYHDALRPLSRDIRSGEMTRREAADYGWGVSYHFIAYLALPVALLTGTVISHMLFLGAEVLGLRARGRAVALAAGGAFGAATLVVVAVIADALAGLAEPFEPAVAAMTDVALWLYPVIPFVAALKLPRPAAGLAVVVAAGASVAAMTALAGSGGSAAATGTLAACAALFAAHVAWARRVPRRTVPTLAVEQRHVRRALPVLALIGAGIGFLAHQGLLAGDPLAALLIADGRYVDAAAVALLTAAAFLPLVAVTSVANDAYATQGTPDWVPAAGYLAPAGLPAAVAGAVAFALEALLAPRSLELVMRDPVISETSAALREAAGDVTLLALLVGGLLAGSILGGPIGILAVAAAWFANEHTGRRVMRLAVGPMAAIAVGLAAAAWHAVS
jgi:hypothetical protein